MVVMRILYVTNGVCGIGGLERVLAHKASYFAETLNYEVIILTLNEKGKSPYFTFSPKIKIISISVDAHPLKYLYQFVTGVGRVINEVKPDKVIVCDDGFKTFLLPSLYRRYEFIYERHVSLSAAIKDRQGFRKWVAQFKVLLMKYLSKNFKHFIVLNEGNRREWQKFAKPIIIPNPIPFVSEKSAPLKNNIAIAVGKQCYQKNYERMLMIWKKVVAVAPDWVLCIYGKKDFALCLDDLVVNLGLTQNVILYDPVSNINEKYMEASIFLMTSRFEGMPMVMLEAMETGLPLVSFDCPHGPRELIIDGENGFLVNYDDDERYVECVINLIQDKGLRESMGRRSRQEGKKYSEGEVFKLWKEILGS